MKLTDIQKWPKDEPDDLTPALGWMAAREAAAETVRAILVRDGDHTQTRQPECADKMFKYAEELPAAIRAIPAPTPARLMAEAVKRPEVAALVAALELSRGAWANVLDLCLIPERHRSTAEELRDVAAAALARHKEATNADM